MGNDHEDYETGAAPAAHKVSHQDGGTDEISIAGLSGESENLASHILLPTVHQDAPDLILTHKGDASAHHAKYTDGEARAAISNIFGADGKADVDIDLDTHKLINVVDPTVNQDAVTLLYLNNAGAAHVADASAHHARYTDAEARAVHSPMSVPPPAFVPRFDTMDWDISSEVLQHRSTLVAQNFYAPVIFPPGVTITKITLAAYRDDADSTIRITTRRCTLAGVGQVMSTLTSNWITGYDKITDEDVEHNVVDNSLYFYVLNLFTDPNDSVNDIKFSGVLIEFTG